MLRLPFSSSGQSGGAEFLAPFCLLEFALESRSVFAVAPSPRENNPNIIVVPSFLRPRSAKMSLGVVAGRNRSPGSYPANRPYGESNFGNLCARPDSSRNAHLRSNNIAYFVNEFYFHSDMHLEIGLIRLP